MKFYITVFCLMLFLVLPFSTSFAQLHWIKDQRNPIMSGGDPGSWNRYIYGPMVLWNTDSARYEMWFTASQNASWPNRIGFATSLDGTTWTMLDTAVLKPTAGTWDETTVDFPAVLRENGQYKMWYSSWQNGSTPKLGYATSPDGITWQKYLGNPVLGPGTEPWEADGATYCNVMPVQGGGYKMWYSGFRSQRDSTAIGYAESSDGIFWQRPLSNPVLTPGSLGEWDDGLLFVGGAGVLFHNGYYYMSYIGGRNWNDPQWQNGLAFSTDGITWTKYNDTTTTNHPYAESDPVLSPSPGEWDGHCAESMTLMLIGDTLRMWYDGWKDPSPPNLSFIGHATMPLDTLLKYAHVTGIKVLNENLPNGYLLHQNYPNPFNPSTNIEFSIPKSEFVTLKVYNILGEEVAMLVSEKLTAGSYKYDWSRTAGMASGVYLYRLQAGNYIEAKKMILLR
jgi:predicted GH43/DUF377 family glycosyl hydrolase